MPRSLPHLRSRAARWGPRPRIHPLRNFEAPRAIAGPCCPVNRREWPWRSPDYACVLMLKTVAAAAFFVIPVVALSACSPNQPVATSPGTTPSVSPAAPSPTNGGQTTGQAATGEKLTAQRKLADGTTVATADIDFTGGFATITVQTTTPAKLTPGFPGLHIHSVGKCEPNSVAPTGGAPGDFLSAGGHSRFPAKVGIPATAETWHRCRSARTKARSW